jgi:hypothetical protein
VSRLLLLFVFLFIVNKIIHAQYRGYGRYQRDLEAQKKAEQEKELEQFYRSYLPIDTAIKFEPGNLPDNPNLSNGKMYYSCGIPLQILKVQKEVRTKSGYHFKSATVYFSGTGFPMVYTAYIEGASLKKIDSLIAQCGIGSVIVFDNVKLSDSTGKEHLTTKSYIVRSDDAKTDSSAGYARKELNEIMKYPFTSGIIYFTNAGFPVVQSIPAAAIYTIKGRELIDRTMPGTVVTFDNCRYFDKEKKAAIIINKLIKL